MSEQKQGQTQKQSFSVDRVYDAPVDAVWNAWTDPERVKEWWGPDGFTSPLCRMDFREGGATLVSMSAPGFGEIYNTWTYTNIVPQSRTEFVMRFSDSEGNNMDPSALGMPPAFHPRCPRRHFRESRRRSNQADGDGERLRLTGSDRAVQGGPGAGSRQARCEP